MQTKKFRKDKLEYSLSVTLNMVIELLKALEYQQLNQDFELET
jgi:hypothetical protein